jgi:uncharacterized protein RhaS with RHS repeats
VFRLLAASRWTRQVKAERAAALARDATQARHKPARRLTEDDIRALITALGDLRDVIRDAEPAEKAATYDQLGLRVTLKPGQDRIRAEVTIRPENYVKQTERYGAMGRVRGGIDPIPHIALYAPVPRLICSAPGIPA